ncbi:PadR family transcriptional regulator [Bifidobacterium oedipodis]|uniref:PadR family transcriptional regulator n=1 Tax=Bifidobacterium oedipodis TaxID=2675322 RepID=A0A7Y0EPS5_9BIFI|nr:PadR family transcriptional regulator [Bifidobacterium sp. DSM 109957]NMM94164.1 PadR family transcriptional regulator [Bifidobacterium sp. DSM 109957]
MGETSETTVPTQMLKGVIEGCVLAVIAREETYGYAISQQLSDYGFGAIAEGTIYPVLLRLERNGHIASQYRQSALGPKRKYYTLTEQGERALQEFQLQFSTLAGAVHSLFEDTAPILNSSTTQGATNKDIKETES